MNHVTHVNEHVSRWRCSCVASCCSVLYFLFACRARISGKPTWRYSDVATFWQRVAASYSALRSFLGNESRNDFREAHLALQPGFLLEQFGDLLLLQAITDGQFLRASGCYLELCFEVPLLHFDIAREILLHAVKAGLQLCDALSVIILHGSKLALILISTLVLL
mmetsp:Transcript_38710/g.56906  ORF Transcript_38710/g.56906 Transcript_38710/m.56906 type:complete len:165 (-) Transcript_38710:1204-1698(-)